MIFRVSRIDAPEAYDINGKTTDYQKVLPAGK